MSLASVSATLRTTLRSSPRAGNSNSLDGANRGIAILLPLNLNPMAKGTLNVVPMAKVSLNPNLPMELGARARYKCHRSMF